jgi:hypothetical protein
MTRPLIAVEIRQYMPLLAAVVQIQSPAWEDYEFAVVLDADSVQSFEIRPRDGGARPITRRRLQDVPLGAIADAVLAKFRAVETEFNELNPSNLLGGGTPLMQMHHDPVTEDELRLARLAQRYVETLGQPKQMESLAQWSRDDPARGHYTDQSTVNAIRRARKSGLLTPTQRGKAGGLLTPRALHVLGEPPNAWEAASPEVKLQTLRREQLGQRIHDELLAAYRAGETDAPTFGARQLASESLLFGDGTEPPDAELADRNVKASAFREAIQYLRDNYEELQR